MPRRSRLLGVDDVGEQRQLLGLVQADEPGQQPRAAAVERQARAWRRSPRTGRPPTRRSGRSPSAMFSPTPAATPLTLAIVGIGRSWSALHDRVDPVHPRQLVAGRVLAALVGQVGARAERAAGAGEHDAAVARVVGRAPGASCPSSSHIALLIAFFFSGRSNVIGDDAPGPLDLQRLHRAARYWWPWASTRSASGARLPSPTPLMVAAALAVLPRCSCSGPSSA